MTGLIVAGGLGRRMGGLEKSSLRLAGETIGGRTVRCLRSCCPRILVATPRPGPWADLDVEIVADAIPEAGPLAGIAAGLAAARTAWVLVVGGDMPRLDPHVLAGLVRRALASGRTTIPRVEGWPQPLHAVYRARDAGRARDALLAGTRKAWAWLEPAEIEWVDLTGPAALSTQGINTPEELSRART